MRAAGQRHLSFGDRYEQIRGDCGPDLHAHSVGVPREEAAQPQVLLDPTEEQLDFPASPANRRDGQGG